MFADAYIYFAIAAAGLISFLSPCVLPLVPAYLGFLGGATLDQMTGDGDERVAPVIYRRIMIASVFFVLGFTTVFVGLGAGASAFGQLIQTYKGELALVAGVVITIFGLHFLGVLNIPLLYREARYHSNSRPASYLGAYVIGLAFAFGWTPCVGPVLAAVLAMAANETSMYTGMSMLLVYSLGLGVPFILAAVAIRPFLGFMVKFRKHLGSVEKLMGILLVITGILFMTGSINWLGQWLLETFPILGQMEEWVVPDNIQEDIMRKGSEQ